MVPEDKSYSSRGQGFMFRVIFLVLVVLGLKEVVCNLQEGSDQGDIICLLSVKLVQRWATTHTDRQTDI